VGQEKGHFFILFKRFDLCLDWIDSVSYYFSNKGIF
jgi:hypothetical protein